MGRHVRGLPVRHAVRLTLVLTLVRALRRALVLRALGCGTPVRRVGGPAVRRGGRLRRVGSLRRIGGVRARLWRPAVRRALRSRRLRGGLHGRLRGRRRPVLAGGRLLVLLPALLGRPRGKRRLLGLA
ncbi:hypothetical protein AB0G06_15885 [Nonomuraea dietziae]|uniref:hypothetical protein n=1 Tax=Nonomuraea dietziae TaxID=65515 RepID=UPI0033CEA24B